MFLSVIKCYENILSSFRRVGGKAGWTGGGGGALEFLYALPARGQDNGVSLGPCSNSVVHRQGR